jgi:two-component sensor histidine kinase
VLHPEDLLITPHLYRREARPPALDAELSAYRELAATMTADPVVAIARFLDLAVELCPAAGSAGLSELTQSPEGKPIFEWTAMSGAFAPYVGGTTPRQFSPCGLCLDHHHTVLVERPGRVFTYFNDAEPEIVEGLIVPLYDTGKRPIGTLWVVSHEKGAQFDGTDARVMEQLAGQLVLAIKLRRKASLMVQLEEVVRDRNLLIQEVRHRVKNMIQMTSGLLQLQERGSKSGEAKVALREAQSRLLVLASVYESLLKPDADDRLVDVSELVAALVQALGETAGQKRPVRVRAECEPVLVPVEKAVPLGLIVNEAVTNALKHAFEPGQPGEILISIACAGEECVLTISDDGCGFEKAEREGSLGMRLMKTLARQLRAELSMDGSAGTSIEVRWRVDHQTKLQERPLADIAVN